MPGRAFFPLPEKENVSSGSQQTRLRTPLIRRLRPFSFCLTRKTSFWDPNSLVIYLFLLSQRAQGVKDAEGKVNVCSDLGSESPFHRQAEGKVHGTALFLDQHKEKVVPAHICCPPLPPGDNPRRLNNILGTVLQDSKTARGGSKTLLGCSKTALGR